MPALTAARVPDRAPTKRERPRCRVRLADGRVFSGPLASERHRALQLGVLHELTDGLVELAAGARRDGRLQITTRRRADHFLPGGRAGGGEWLEALLDLAERHADRGEEVFVAPAVREAARGEKRAVTETRFLWVDVDQPGQLQSLWAFLAQRPCHLLIESGVIRSARWWSAGVAGDERWRHVANGAGVVDAGGASAAYDMHDLSVAPARVGQDARSRGWWL